MWAPHTAKNIHKLEMVQRRAARWAVNRYHKTSSVTEMLDHLQWRSLESRRDTSSLSLFFKMATGRAAVNLNDHLRPITRPTRHSHSHSFIQPQCGSDAYNHSFFPRTLRLWNALPQGVVSSPTLDSYKSAVAKSLLQA